MMIGPYTDGPASPIWQIGPAPTDAGIVNTDLFSHKILRDVLKRARKSGKTALSPIFDVQFLVEHSNIEVDDDDRRRRRRQMAQSRGEESSASEEQVMAPDAEEESIESEGERDEDEGGEEGGEEESTGPRAVVVQPVFSSFDDDKTVTAFVLATFSWSRVFKNTQVVNNMQVVLTSSCGGVYTFDIEEMFATFKGEADLHDTSMDYLRKRQEFEPFQEEWEELLHVIEDEDETDCEVGLMLMIHRAAIDKSYAY